MTLEFRPPFQIDPFAQTQSQRSLANLTGTISDLGNTVMQYSQQQKENRIRQAMLQLQQQKGAREQGVYNYEYGDPNASGGYGGGTPGATAPSPSGALTQGTNGPQPQGYEDQTTMQGIPGQPPQPPMQSLASGPQPNVPQPMHQPGTDLTSHFQAWQSQGQPPQYNHPQMGSQPQGQEGTNPDDPYNLGMSMRQVGLKRYMAMEGISKEQAGGRLLAGSPIAKSMFGSANPQDLSHFGDEAPNILMKGAELQSSQNYKNATLNVGQDKFQNSMEQQFQDRLDKIISNRSGGLGQQDGKVNQAIHLRQMINQAYDPKSGQYNLPEMQTGELAMGLANLVSNGNVATVEQLRAVTPKTMSGDMAHIVSYWTGTPVNNQPQAMIQNLVHAIDRQGMTSQQLRDNYINQIKTQIPTSLRPERAQAIISQKLGNNYSDYVNQQNQGGQGNQQYSKTATGSNGQKVGWNGQEWVSIQ